MVQLAGKYKLEKNVGFLDFLLKNGIPADKAAIMNESKPTLDIKVDGEKITVDIDGTQKQTNVFIFNQEVDEMLQGIPLKSTATKNGDEVTVTSKRDGKPAGKRVYKFKDTELEVDVYGEGSQCTRIYKRL